MPSTRAAITAQKMIFFVFVVIIFYFKWLNVLSLYSTEPLPRTPSYANSFAAPTRNVMDAEAHSGMRADRKRQRTRLTRKCNSPS